MKTLFKSFPARLVCAVALGTQVSLGEAAAGGNPADTAPAKTSAAIPWSELGAKAGADSQGEGLAVRAAVEAGACGPQLALAHSGRRIAYSRLRATDARGKELAARMEEEGLLSADSAD